MQTIRFGRKNLICLLGLALIIQLEVIPSLGQEVSEQFFQKFSLKVQSNYQNLEFQSSEENQKNFEPKSESKALTWSLGSTLVPIVAGITIWALDGPDSVIEYNQYGGISARYEKDPNRTLPVSLILSGVIIGPSVGYIYGGRTGRGLKGVGIRTGVGLVSIGLAVLAAKAAESDEPFDFSGAVAGLTVLFAGSALVVVLAIQDIARVKSEVQKRNQNLLLKTSWIVTPKYFSKSEAGGIEIKIKF